MPSKPSRISLALPILLAAALGFGAVCPGGALAREGTWTNGIGMEFALMPSGTFTLGAAPPGDPDAERDEAPPHAVTLTRGFWCSLTEVTQAQWEQVMGEGSSPSLFKGPERPVENVSYGDALAFVEALNRLEKTGRYRLPTEAEWAYAAKAGTSTPWSWGPDPADADAYAWYRGNSGNETGPVKGRLPNPWGLFGMHGNVWEWVADWYGDGWYAEGPEADPRGPSDGAERVVRGGAWDNEPKHMRSDNRAQQLPGTRDQSVGFRIVFTSGQVKKRLYQDGT
jgi:formylglycine-generating enzyme required for sulfatase activity